MPKPAIASLEIGTTRTVVLVGEADPNGRITIVGRGTYPSTGVRKGLVCDLALARGGVEAAVRQAAEQSHITIGDVLLVVSGGHIEAVVNRGTLPVHTRDRVVTREVREEVLELAKAVDLPPDREVVHTIGQCFTLDGQAGIAKPDGMQGTQLAVDMLVVHAVRNRVDNAIKVACDVPLQVQDVAFSGLCAALGVLTPEQKRNGAAVIDLGGGTTSWLAYAGSVMATAGSLGVGGDHVTNDIALAFNIPLARAEEIKRSEGSATIDPAAGLRRVTLPQEGGFPERVIGLKALHTVIQARAEETLCLVRNALDEAGVLSQLGAGVVLTGGGAYLRRLPDLVHRVFGLPCTIGEPRNVAGLADAPDAASFAAAAGGVIYGFKTLQESSVISRLNAWLKRGGRR